MASAISTNEPKEKSHQSDDDDDDDDGDDEQGLLRASKYSKPVISIHIGHSTSSGMTDGSSSPYAMVRRTMIEDTRLIFFLQSPGLSNIADQYNEEEEDEEEEEEEEQEEEEEEEEETNSESYSISSKRKLDDTDEHEQNKVFKRNSDQSDS